VRISESDTGAKLKSVGDEGEGDSSLLKIKKHNNGEEGKKSCHGRDEPQKAQRSRRYKVGERRSAGSEKFRMHVKSWEKIQRDVVLRWGKEEFLPDQSQEVPFGGGASSFWGREKERAQGKSGGVGGGGKDVRRRKSQCEKGHRHAHFGVRSQRKKSKNRVENGGVA